MRYEKHLITYSFVKDIFKKWMEDNMDQKEEYLMLRDEILHIDTMINNTINFFYVFMASYLAFVFSKKETLLLLVSYIVIMPAYFMVLSKMEGMCRIGAYLQVFYEGKTFNWETHNYQFRNYRIVKVFNHMISTNFPFLLGSLSVLIIHIHQYLMLEIQTCNEKIKLHISFVLFIVMCLLIFKYRKLSTDDYITKWNLYKQVKKYL